MQRLFNGGDEDSPEEKLHSVIQSLARLTRLEAENRQMIERQKEINEKMDQLEAENRQLRQTRQLSETENRQLRGELDSIKNILYEPNHLESAKTVALKVLSPYVRAGHFRERRLYTEMTDFLTKCLFEVDSIKHENTRTRAKKATERVVRIFFAGVDRVTRSADLKKLMLADLAELKQPVTREKNWLKRIAKLFRSFV